MVYRLVSRLRTSIQQYTDLRFQLFTNSVEQPSMRVDLLGIFLLEHKDDLYRDLLPVSL